MAFEVGCRCHSIQAPTNEHPSYLVGAFLRVILFFVLTKGMSVVGPRPALPNEVTTYDGYQRQRLLVKPGMTRYWQTRCNRDSIAFDEWVDLDSWWAYAFSPSC